MVCVCVYVCVCLCVCLCVCVCVCDEETQIDKIIAEMSQQWLMSPH